MPISTIPPATPREPSAEELANSFINHDIYDSQVKGIQKLSSVNELMTQSRGALVQSVNQSVAQSAGNFDVVQKQSDEALQSIIDSASANIEDPEVQREYETQMKSLYQEEMLKAKGLVRSQQLERMKASFIGEHQSLLQQVQSDPFSPIEHYTQEYGGKIAAAKAHGLFTEQEAFELYKAFRSDAGRAKAQAMIGFDPVATRELLEASPEQFALEGQELQDMKELADKTIHDNEVKARAEERQRQANDEVQRQLLKADISEKIADGRGGAAEIEASKNILDPNTVKSLKRDLTEKREEKRKADITYNKIMDRVRNEGDLSEFSSADRNAAFNATVDKMRVVAGIPEGQPTPLSLKASLARLFKGNVPSLQKDMEYGIESADENVAIEAMNAYKVLQADNPEAISGMSSKSHAIASYALELIDKTGAPDTQAIARARAMVNVDDSIRKERASAFGRLSSFKASNVGETAREALGGDPWFGFNRDLAPGVSEAFRDLAREAYTLTGDEDAAVSSATQQMKRFYGETSFNGGRHIMFAPPEKMFPSVKPEIIHKQFNADLRQVFPNIDVEKLQIVGDDLTRSSRGKVSWAVIAVDDFGMPFQLQDPKTGAMLRWEVSNVDLLRQSKSQELQKLREQAQITKQAKDVSKLPSGDILDLRGL